jgi:hypothetical protein
MSVTDRTPRPQRTERETGKLGKLAPQFPVALKELHSYTVEPLPAAPAAVDHSAKVPTFPMDGNDKYGDCTMAAAAHLIQSWNADVDVTMPVPTPTEVVAEYLKLSRGADSGLVESRVLKTWMASGLWGNKITGYAPVNVHNLESLKKAVAYFGGVYVGIQVPDNAMDQFRAGQPWSLVADWQNQGIEGGHAIPILGYDDQWMYCVTWGAVQKMAWDWWSAYGDEAWVVLSKEYEEAGHPINGIDVAALKADLASI